jgi:glucose dehydrogenase
MKPQRFVVFLSIVTVLVVQASSTPAQQNAVTSVNWPLHNLDLAGSRYSAMDQITRSNVATLSPRWLFQYGIIDGVSNQTTPIVVDGVMYVVQPPNDVIALDAATGVAPR